MFARFALYTIATLGFLAFMSGVRWLVYSHSHDFSMGLLVGGGGMLAIVWLYEWSTGTQLGDQLPAQTTAESSPPEIQDDPTSKPQQMLPPASARNG